MQSGEYLPATNSIYSLQEEAATACQNNDCLAPTFMYLGTDAISDLLEYISSSQRLESQL